MTASLETLQQVVRSGPSLLVYLLTSPAGLGKSRLSFDQVRKVIRDLLENIYLPTFTAHELVKTTLLRDKICFFKLP